MKKVEFGIDWVILKYVTHGLMVLYGNIEWRGIKDEAMSCDGILCRPNSIPVSRHRK